MIAVGQIRRGPDDTIRVDDGPRNGMWRCVFKSLSRVDAQDDSEWISDEDIEKDFPKVLDELEAELEEERFHGDDEEAPIAPLNNIVLGQVRTGPRDTILIVGHEGGYGVVFKSLVAARQGATPYKVSEAEILRDYPAILPMNADDFYRAATPSAEDLVRIVRKGTPPIEYIEINLDCGQDAGIYVERAETEPDLFVIRCFGKGRETFNKAQLRGLAEALLELAREP